MDANGTRMWAELRLSSREEPRDAVNARSIMLIAGEPSGDSLAAELVAALRAEVEKGVPAQRPGVPAHRPGLPAHRQDVFAHRQEVFAHRQGSFFGAGGPQMAAAGVELAFDMTQHAVVGLVEVIRNYGKFKRLFDQLVALALRRQPDLIVCVDFSGFNRRFARQIRWEICVREIRDWQPKIVQYVSPQVWASRPGRARSMARDLDLLLTIFPFEKQWYAERVPRLRVEFVGHPMVERYAKISPSAKDPGPPQASSSPRILLLPGSRVSELKRHLPVMLEAWKQIRTAQPAARACVVLPNESLAALGKTLVAATLPDLSIQVGQLDRGRIGCFKA